MASKGNKRQPVQAAGLSESLIAALKKELRGEPPPPGWYTCAQIAEMLGISFERATRLALNKKWKCAPYATVTTDNRRLVVKHFLVK